MMRNIKLTVEYDGRRYLGWQRLGDSEKTIQGKIETALKQIIGEEVEIIGSGRTDAGTHARGQVANFKMENQMAVSDLVAFLNRALPGDIVVKKAEEMPERFHARYNAVAKRYSYQVWNNPIPTAFERHRSFHVPQQLDLAKMHEACEKLVGEHDFLGFSALKKSKKSTVRRIDEITIEGQPGEGMLVFTFVGDGFLHKMVRILTGTLVEIGAGRLEMAAIDEVFASKVRMNAGETAPAQGLFLDKVFYK